MDNEGCAAEHTCGLSLEELRERVASSGGDASPGGLEFGSAEERAAAEAAAATTLEVARGAAAGSPQSPNKAATRSDAFSEER